jgi:hypothetical protein
MSQGANSFGASVLGSFETGPRELDRTRDENSGYFNLTLFKGHNTQTVLVVVDRYGHSES